MSGVPLTRKRSFPSVTGKIVGRDFRKEFRGSFLEKKSREEAKKKSVWEGFKRGLSLWAAVFSDSPRRRPREAARRLSPLELLPTELFLHILRPLDLDTARACRLVSRCWKNALEAAVDGLQPRLSVSRLVVSACTEGRRRFLEISWCNYEKRQNRLLQLPWSFVRERRLLTFAFSHFHIHRLIFKDMPSWAFSDGFVEWLRVQLAASQDFAPLQLSFDRVDFSQATPFAFHRLFALCGRQLQVLEMERVSGLRHDLLSDMHVAQLNTSNLRRLVLDALKFSTTSLHRTLQIGDETLEKFALEGNFPTLTLDRCAVSSRKICDYMERWLRRAEELGDPGGKSHQAMFKRCPKVKARDLEEECKRRRLKYKKEMKEFHSTTDLNDVSLQQGTCYSIQCGHRRNEFTVALCSSHIAVEVEEQSRHLAS